MLAGELYQAFDPELVAERQKAKSLCFRLNATPPDEKEKRDAIVKDLLGLQDHDDDDQSAWIESPFWVDYGIHCRIGKNFYANHGCTILDCNLVTIGDRCLLAPGVCISAATHPLEAERRAAGEEYTAPITLGNDCWLGANSTICPGVTLGNGVVVGAGAVVTKSFGDNVVLGGVPARVLKTIPTSTQER